MRSRVLTSRYRERVLVACKSNGHPGRVFDGVLYSADAQTLVLRAASVIGEGENGTPLPVDGEIIIFVADIDYLQRPS